jgi:hypothetical protein
VGIAGAAGERLFCIAAVGERLQSGIAAGSERLQLGITSGSERLQLGIAASGWTYNSGGARTSSSRQVG